MASPVVLGLLLAIAGLVVGIGLARLSCWLAEKPFVLRSQRTLAFALASAAIGAGACLWGLNGEYGAPVIGFTALLGWQLLLIAWVDAENFWLPDIITVPLGLTGIAASLLLPYPFGAGWVFALISGVAGFSALWLVAFAYRKVRGHSGLGGGDPILFGMGAVWVGLFELVTVTLIAAISGMAIALILKLLGRKIGMKSKLPFGTYLAIGFAVCWLIA